jgi:hypothetical protein
MAIKKIEKDRKGVAEAKKAGDTTATRSRELRETKHMSSRGRT